MTEPTDAECELAELVVDIPEVATTMTFKQLREASPGDAELVLEQVRAIERQVRGRVALELEPLSATMRAASEGVVDEIHRNYGIGRHARKQARDQE